MNTLTDLIPHGVNGMLIMIVAFFVKHELRDIKDRITRIENTFFRKE